MLLQTRPEKKHLAQFGLDLIKGEVRNNVQAGVLEPVLAKTKIIQVNVTINSLAGLAAVCQCTIVSSVKSVALKSMYGDAVCY